MFKTPIVRASSYEGVPRVVNDVELYYVVVAMAEQKDSAQDIREYVRLWASPIQDWQLRIMVKRAQLFLGSLRQELGQRLKLDPNQLRLLEDMWDGDES